MGDRVQTFLAKLREAGGTYRVLWTAKRNPESRYDDLYYIATYGRENADGGQPLACGVILNDLGSQGGGLEVLFSSPATDYESDVQAILRIAERRALASTAAESVTVYEALDIRV